MTQKIQRTGGADFETFVVEGDTYKISPLRLGHWSEMESYVSSLRQNPIDIASANLNGKPLAVQQMIMDAAVKAACYAKIVPAVEIANFEASITGLAWKLWKTLEPNHPEINSVSEAVFILTAAGADRLAEIKAKLHVGSGEADLKK